MPNGRIPRTGSSGPTPEANLPRSSPERICAGRPTSLLAQLRSDSFPVRARKVEFLIPTSQPPQEQAGRAHPKERVRIRISGSASADCRHCEPVSMIAPKHVTGVLQTQRLERPPLEVWLHGPRVVGMTPPLGPRTGHRWTGPPDRPLQIPVRYPCRPPGPAGNRKLPGICGKFQQFPEF